MKDKKYLLDTSFLIDYEREIEGDVVGPARRLFSKISKSGVWISVVTVAELLEGAADQEEAMKRLAAFKVAKIGAKEAERCALNQRRTKSRMGENDAWQAAIAFRGNYCLVGKDKGFENRPWLDYLNYKTA